MNRVYTATHYMDLVETARNRIPNLLLSTDLIVGFPGETEEEYRDTERLVREVGYDDAFIYKYSERPDKEKVRRLMRLNEIVRASGQQRRLAQIGQTFSVLIEGPSSKDAGEQMGRTPSGYVVIVPGEFSPGTELDVRITTLSGYTLRGRVV